jgi:hypothetical protein
MRDVDAAFLEATEASCMGDVDAALSSPTNPRQLGL